MNFPIKRKPRAFLYAQLFAGWLWWCFRWTDGPRWYRFFRAHHIAMTGVDASAFLEKDKAINIEFNRP